MGKLVYALCHEESIRRRWGAPFIDLPNYWRHGLQDLTLNTSNKVKSVFSERKEQLFGEI